MTTQPCLPITLTQEMLQDLESIDFQNNIENFYLQPGDEITNCDIEEVLDTNSNFALDLFDDAPTVNFGGTFSILEKHFPELAEKLWQDNLDVLWNSPDLSARKDAIRNLLQLDPEKFIPILEEINETPGLKGVKDFIQYHINHYDAGLLPSIDWIDRNADSTRLYAETKMTRPVAELLSDLESPDYDTRKEAISELSYHRTGEVDQALCKAFKKEQIAALRKRILYSLSRSMPNETDLFLAEIIQTEQDEETLKKAIEMIGSIKTPLAEQTLCDIFESPNILNRRVSYVTIKALFGFQSERTQRILFDTLRESQSEDMRDKAAWALKNIDPETMHPDILNDWFELFKSPTATTEIRSSFTSYLAKHNPTKNRDEHHLALIEALKQSDDSRFSKNIIYALRNFPTSFTVHVLEGIILHNEDKDVKNSGIRTLITIYKQTPGKNEYAERILLYALSHNPSSSARVVVATNAWEINSDKCLAKLTAIINNPEEKEDLRTACIKSLSGFAISHTEEVVELLDTLSQQSESASINQAIIFTLGAIGQNLTEPNPLVQDMLTDFLKKGDTPRIREKAAENIARMSQEGIADKEALQDALIHTLLKDDYDYARYEAAQTLARFPSDKTKEAYITVAQEDTLQIYRSQAIRNLSYYRDPEVTDLYRTLAKQSSFHRDSFIWELTYRTLPSEENMFLFIDILINDKDRRVRQKAAEAIQYYLCDEAKEALKYALIMDSDSDVRRQAASSLAYFEGDDVQETLQYVAKRPVGRGQHQVSRAAYASLSYFETD